MKSKDLKHPDDVDLNDGKPVRFGDELEKMLYDVMASTGLDRGQVVRRAVRLLMDEVKRQGSADFLVPNKRPPVGFLLSEPKRVDHP